MFTDRRFLQDYKIDYALGINDKNFEIAAQSLNLSYFDLSTYILREKSLGIKTFKLHPDQETINSCLLDLICAYKWEHVAIFYEPHYCKNFFIHQIYL